MFQNKAHYCLHTTERLRNNLQSAAFDQPRKAIEEKLIKIEQLVGNSRIQNLLSFSMCTHILFDKCWRTILVSDE